MQRSDIIALLAIWLVSANLPSAGPTDAASALVTMTAGLALAALFAWHRRRKVVAGPLYLSGVSGAKRRQPLNRP